MMTDAVSLSSRSPRDSLSLSLATECTHIFNEAGLSWTLLLSAGCAWKPPRPARAGTGVVPEGGVGVAPGPIRPDCLSIASSAEGSDGGGAAAGLAGSAGACDGGDRRAAIDGAAAGGAATGCACGGVAVC